jgi:hypothetical protein
MGLKNRDTNKKYLKLKEGKFYIGKDTETPYEELEGTIVGMRYKDEEYEGNPIRKLAIVINDGEDNYELGIDVERSNYTTLVSFLKNVDVTRKLTLHPKVEKVEGKEFPKQSILVSQDGKYAKGYFTKTDNHGLPEWKSVKVGKKVIWDKTEYNAFLEEFVQENFISKIEGNRDTAAVIDEDKAPKREAVDAFETADAQDYTAPNKLPWETQDDE